MGSTPTTLNFFPLLRFFFSFFLPVKHQGLLSFESNREWGYGPVKKTADLKKKLMAQFLMSYEL